MSKKPPTKVVPPKKAAPPKKHAEVAPPAPKNPAEQVRQTPKDDRVPAGQAKEGPSKPSRGRVVLYHDREEWVESVRQARASGGEIGIHDVGVPAIIRRVRDEFGVSDLVVFSDLGALNKDAVPFGKEPAPGCWTWPPRV